jgi:T-complex protein 1 subunit zeta
VLLKEMQIQNPTAVMIARTAVAQDDITGDGTSSTVLIIGELLKQAERYLNEGLHPRVLVEGFDAAKRASIKFLEDFKVPCPGVANPDKEILTCVARTALRSKLREDLADKLTSIVVDAVCLVAKKDEPIDLHMVEIMHMRHKLDSDTRLVSGLVLDHGARHPDMKKHVDDAFILTCNISMEYEKSEVNSSFMYSDAEQRERMVAAEREYTDDVVRQVIALKKKVCDGNDKGFVVITQKGIDPISLDMLAKEGIVGLRRAKKRNMERLVLSCGGVCINSPEELSPEVLGHAGKVYEHVLGEEKYTFVEDVANPQSCTILLKGPNDHTIAQLKDAVRDGLRAVKNALVDEALVPGAGAFESALSVHLLDEVRKSVEGRAKRGVEAFAEAMLVIPKTLAENSGYDAQDVCIALADEVAKGNKVGLDVTTGEAFDPAVAGVYDNFIVKAQILHSAPVIATQLLLVDEVMRAGVNMRKR